MPRVSVSELRDTVRRMELKLSALEDPLVASLLEHYGALKSRFQADLRTERDFLLSCGGALMLIQAMATKGGSALGQGSATTSRMAPCSPVSMPSEPQA